jgi:hypothetical protein
VAAVGADEFDLSQPFQIHADNMPHLSRTSVTAI